MADFGETALFILFDLLSDVSNHAVDIQMWTVALIQNFHLCSLESHGLVGARRAN